MKVMNVSCALLIPDGVTPEQTDEWVRYCFGLGAIEDDNPLLDRPLVALVHPGSVQTLLLDFQMEWPEFGDVMPSDFQAIASADAGSHPSGSCC